MWTITSTCRKFPVSRRLKCSLAFQSWRRAWLWVMLCSSQIKGQERVCGPLQTLPAVGISGGSVWLALESGRSMDSMDQPRPTHAVTFVNLSGLFPHAEIPIQSRYACNGAPHSLRVFTLSNVTALWPSHWGLPNLLYDCWLLCPYLYYRVLTYPW